MNDLLRDGGQDRFALLQTFLRVAEAGSFSAAAVQLGTTQPTVSRRVQMLEALLGARLVERSTRGLRLTEEGERCAAQARDLLDRWESLAEDVGDKGESLSGTLRLRVPHAFGQSQLMDPLTTFMRRHPRVTVEWSLQDQVPDFSREAVDCSLVVGHVDQPNLVAVQLAEVPRVLVASPEIAAALPEGFTARVEEPAPAAAPARALARVTSRRPAGGLRGTTRSPAVASAPSAEAVVAALRAAPWLALTTFYRDEIELRPQAGGESVCVPIHPRFGTDSLFALIEATRRGLGMALISQWAVMEDQSQGRLVRVLPNWCATPLPISLVYPSRRLQPARLRAFVALMRQVVPTMPGMRQARRH
ncbi:LysR family transcriptional regulator [Roseateles amylovorans]|uniref:LysR family transcriptional regulator n=1 Tax=Roseateles amylovorans TaxID=2978473 RepID=A0ABY6AZ78_9BURK|nr:LysR family transcriptional regulator [Roseateles amylovorans]UXH77593.1 LysR family transcriptional regulator [Roseateles amylovorans]